MPIRERKIRKLTQVDREARAVSVVSGSMLRPRILGPLISLGELGKKKRKETPIVCYILWIYLFIYYTHQDRNNPSMQEYEYLPTYNIENLQYDKRPSVKLILDSGGEETTAVGQ